MRQDDRNDPLVSLVLPVFNESEAIQTLVEQLRTAMEQAQLRYEMVFVNDGSTDDSGDQLDGLAETDPRIRVVHFSRNFGHQPALQAGLNYAAGDVAVVMDSDLQDDPRSIPRMVEKWQEGFEVVYAIRTQRKEGLIKRGLFYAFYRVLNAVSRSPIPNDAGNFGLMDRQVVDTVRRMCDADRYFPGLRCWSGFRQVGIEVERLARHDETPRVSWFQLIQLAKSAIFSFSRVPLSLFYAISILSLVICFGCFAFTLYHKVMTGLAVPGWASGIMTASFFGALNALGIGVLGEYVVRIYDQVRNRPQYVVARVENSLAASASRDGNVTCEEEVLNQIREFPPVTPQSLSPQPIQTPST